VGFNQTSDYLDLALLEHYLDSLGKTIVEQMFELYCQQVVIYIADIENAVTNKSTISWRQYCHKMKGAAGSVGMVALNDSLKKLEKIDIEQLSNTTMVANLKIQNEQSIVAFKYWLESLQSNKC
jgi:HPt (histidine-containing phosphotransfer) domain-containing protein